MIPAHELADILIATGNVGVALAVLPKVWHQYRNKVCATPLLTSLGRVAFLLVMGTGFILDDLWLATAFLTGNIAIWLTIALQNKLYAHQTVSNGGSQ